jgi:hypothetical protein
MRTPNSTYKSDYIWRRTEESPNIAIIFLSIGGYWWKFFYPSRPPPSRRLSTIYKARKIHSSSPSFSQAFPRSDPPPCVASKILSRVPELRLLMPGRTASWVEQFVPDSTSVLHRIFPLLSSRHPHVHHKLGKTRPVPASQLPLRGPTDPLKVSWTFQTKLSGGILSKRIPSSHCALPSVAYFETRIGGGGAY